MPPMHREAVGCVRAVGVARLWETRETHSQDGAQTGLGAGGLQDATHRGRLNEEEGDVELVDWE
jgi:hypothetical protein